MKPGPQKKDQILQFFKYDHLPHDLHLVSRRFLKLAEEIQTDLPKNEERDAAMRKLLEAKDAAVRSAFFISED